MVTNVAAQQSLEVTRMARCVARLKSGRDHLRASRRHASLQRGPSGVRYYFTVLNYFVYTCMHFVALEPLVMLKQARKRVTLLR